MTTPTHNLDANSERPIDEMPAMPLEKGMAMALMAIEEEYYVWASVDLTFIRRQFFAAQEADNKWQKLQSERDTEKANRFWIRARGWARLAAAFGGGSMVTLVIEHLLLA